MKNQNIALLICFTLITMLVSPLSMAKDNKEDETACQVFENKYDEYFKSTGKDESGKPMASEQSIPIAWELIGIAEDCLTERSVTFERISTYAVKFSPDSNTEPGKTAALLKNLTNGAVIYDVGFFLRKPYAAGGFAENILFLPHTAVLGKLDMVTRHELNHARAHALLINNDLRLRHQWIFAEDTMYVDEVLAYADGAINQENAERMRSSSLRMAKHYIAATRKFIKNPDVEFALSKDGPRCPMSEALKNAVSNMLSCIEIVLESENGQPAEVALCDVQQEQKPVCSP